MFTLNDKRINIDAAFTSADGITYANLRDPYLRMAFGIQEISDPAPPADFSDETYYRTEQDDAPYVVFTRKSDEQIEQARKARIQAQIDAMERDALLARPAREFMLLQMEAIAAGQGVTPEQLREQHYGYRKVKEFDETIAALRASL